MTWKIDITNNAFRQAFESNYSKKNNDGKADKIYDVVLKYKKLNGFQRFFNTKAKRDLVEEFTSIVSDTNLVSTLQAAVFGLNDKGEIDSFPAKPVSGPQLPPTDHTARDGNQQQSTGEYAAAPRFEDAPATQPGAAAAGYANAGGGSRKLAVLDWSMASYPILRQ